MEGDGANGAIGAACSYCGNVFCDLCTMRRSLIREDQILSNPARQYLPANVHNPQRVCDDCHARLEAEQDSLRELECPRYWKLRTNGNEYGAGETMSQAVQYTELREGGPQRFLNMPYSFTLREEVRKAAYSVKNFMYQGVIKDQSIPLPLLTQAKGIAVSRSAFFSIARVAHH